MLFSDEDVGQEDQIGCRYNHNTKIVHDKVTETCAITVKEMRFYWVKYAKGPLQGQFWSVNFEGMRRILQDTLILGQSLSYREKC